MKTLLENRHFWLGPVIIGLAVLLPFPFSILQVMGGVFYILIGVKRTQTKVLDEALDGAWEAHKKAQEQADRALALVDEAQALLRDAQARIIDLQAQIIRQNAAPLGQQAGGGPTVSATGG